MKTYVQDKKMNINIAEPDKKVNIKELDKFCREHQLVTVH